MTYPLVRYLACLDPREMLTAKRDRNVKRLTGCLDILVEAKKLDPSSCDHVISQYDTLIKDIN